MPTAWSSRLAAHRLVKLLAERGDVAGLARRAHIGDPYAARRLAVMLAERGDIDSVSPARIAPDRLEHLGFTGHQRSSSAAQDHLP